jgi:protein HIRA/HIR1
MVIAEIPLWVIHNNNNNNNSNTNNNDGHAGTDRQWMMNTATGMNSNTKPVSFGTKGMPLGGGDDDDDPTSQAARNALQSYYWLPTTMSTNNNTTSDPQQPTSFVGGGMTSNSSGGSNSFTPTAKKCAIYSMDICGSIFATAGGDGTVRIWNIHALFSVEQRKNHTTNSNNSNNNMIRGAHYDPQTGVYVSSESSHHSQSSVEEDYDNSSTGSTNMGSNGHQKTDATQRTRNDISLDPSLPTTTYTQPVVHDLNATVRSKRKTTNPTVSSSSPSRTIPSTTTNRAAVDTNKVSTVSMQQPSRNGASGSSGGGGNRSTQQPPRLLCTLSAHTGSSVLAVRFSNSGQYIASAGDDGCVCIYARSLAIVPGGGSGGSLLRHGSDDGNSGAAHRNNNWSRIKLCRGHNLDVVDLAWSPDDSYLVSCSLDSATPIIVWKLNDLQNESHQPPKSMICNPYKILGQSVHTSTVKGVAFDPAGSYLASSGDDPAVCIWRTHDDWGLEKRIDAESGIFRKWNFQSKDTSGNVGEHYDDIQALSSQSLFRRISWSTDGAFLCSTNSVVKNKHVASTIARERWNVSGSGGSGMTEQSSGAANLVGHKQPIVVSRHSSQLLNARKNRSSKSLRPDSDGKSNVDDENDDDEKNMDDDNDGDDDVPEYATLLALGDRRGFVTVWSTRKSRPLFKVQCSESHCTVTDLAWGVLRNGDLLLLVSLLDGQVFAFRFAVPDELGSVLTKNEKARVFQLRYGIDIDSTDDSRGVFGRRHGFGSGKSGPNLIENALQMTLEEDMKTNDDMTVDINSEAVVNDQQIESRSVNGKKRVRPVLVQMDSINGNKHHRTSIATLQPATTATPDTVDLLQGAINAAEKATVVAENVNTIRKDGHDTMEGEAEQASTRTVAQSHHRHSSVPVIAALRHSTERIHCADLPLSIDVNPLQERDVSTAFVVECVNRTKVPTGSKGGSIPCIDVTISHDGRAVWKDQILGTACSALSASDKLFAVGTTDGSVQLYGTSPILGWSCGNSFRSHAPLIFGTPIVSLQLIEQEAHNDKPTGCLDMLVVTSDGAFGVWTILPDLRLQYKGFLLPALTHMSFSADGCRMPTLARIHITDLGHLFLLLSLESFTVTRPPSADKVPSKTTTHCDAGTGGSLQAFVYDKKSELWFRVSDSRFVLSDFYSALPSSTSASLGALSRMDDAVRLGSLQSSLKAAQRSRNYDRQADAIYEQGDEESGNFLASRSHCEDRMACALVMKSVPEFKHWLRLYVRVLAIRGQISQIRILVDILLQHGDESTAISSCQKSDCWWLSGAATQLNETGLSLIRDLVIPEISKSRVLQRLTNEISMEVETQVQLN